MKVTLDDAAFPVLEAQAFGPDWNGWKTPLFDFDAVVRAGLAMLELGWGIAAYDEETRTFSFALLDGAPYQPGFLLDWTEETEAGRGRQIDERLEEFAPNEAGLWAIGDGWCWEVVICDCGEAACSLAEL